MSEVDKQLAEFGRWVLLYHRDNECGDVDGGTLQDHAIALGLLEYVTKDAPCGENCSCAEWTDTWPTQCLRIAKGVRV